MVLFFSLIPLQLCYVGKPGPRPSPHVGKHRHLANPPPPCLPTLVYGCLQISNYNLDCVLCINLEIEEWFETDKFPILEPLHIKSCTRLKALYVHTYVQVHMTLKVNLLLAMHDAFMLDWQRVIMSNFLFRKLYTSIYVARNLGNFKNIFGWSFQNFIFSGFLI